MNLLSFSIIFSVLILTFVSFEVDAKKQYSKDYQKGYDDGYGGKNPIEPNNNEYMKGWDDGLQDNIDGNDPTIFEEDEVNPPIFPQPPPEIDEDGGDPLLFSFNGNACTYRAYPEMHESRFHTLDLLVNNQTVTLSRILCNNTFTMFVDFNQDSILDGQEWGFGNHTIYENLKILDSNDNGFFDYSDYYWNDVVITDFNKEYTTEELEIFGFDYTNAVNTFNDMHGNGRYADCIYEGQLFYYFCEPVSKQSGFRITSYHVQGVITTHGVYPSYGALMGIMK